MKIGEVLEILETIGSDQWGIVTTAQAQREGISRLQINRLAQKGVLQKDSQGVYFLPSAPMGPSAQIQASWISLDPKHFLSERWEKGPEIVVSHESAAAIHGIGNLIPQADVFSATKRKQTSRSGIKILSNQSVDRNDIANIDGLPVTSIERTVADLAAQRIERNYLSIVVADALEKEGVGFYSLASRLDEYCVHYAATSGQELVEEFFRENSSIENHQNIVAQANAIKDKMNQQTSPAFRMAMKGVGHTAWDSIDPSLLSHFATIQSGQEERIRRIVQSTMQQSLEPILKAFESHIDLAALSPSVIKPVEVSTFLNAKAFEMTSGFLDSWANQNVERISSRPVQESGEATKEPDRSSENSEEEAEVSNDVTVEKENKYEPEED